MPATVFTYLIVCQLQKLASTIGSLPQQVESFTSLQNRQLLLTPLGNTPTRWNSTFIMLVRALRLPPEIYYWTSAESSSRLFADMHLSEEEWDHVRYLVALLYPYYLWTEKLSKTTGPTIHKAWAVYTALFEHLVQAEGSLLRKAEPWKVLLADSVVAAHRKLSQYYSNADGRRGKIYNLATVHDPSQRLAVYKSLNFEPRLYRQYDRDFGQAYEQSYSQLDGQPSLQLSQLRQRLD